MGLRRKPGINLFGLKYTVYIVRVSYDQKPYRKPMINIWGATIYPSPSPETNACHAALAFSYLREKINGLNVRILAVELGLMPQHHQGRLRLQLRRHRPTWRSSSGCTPWGTPSCPRASMPAACATRHSPPGQPPGGGQAHQGHGAEPDGMLRGRRAVFARSEGVIPAPESTHAIRGAIDKAMRAKEERKERVILSKLFAGNQGVVRYLWGGTVFTFQSMVLGYISQPFSLVFLS